ncbi:MAG: hypothetical protein KDA42_14425 [Planctomycetales bacterium]|nr:hypothetical protein [Planctomycetales bacterium]
MLRSLHLLLVATMFTCAGCAMCQDCQDELGAVPDSENYSTYEHGDRAGSAFTGGAMASGETEQYLDMSVGQGPTLAEPEAAARPSSRR